MDFGCAVGFLVKHLTLNNLCIGYDISDWAIDYGKNVLNIDPLTNSYQKVIEKEYDTVLFLDVLEHIRLQEVHQILGDLKSKSIIVRIPVPEHDNGDFLLDVSKNDPTHITKLSKQSWINVFKKHYYNCVKPLDLNHIWDSPGVFCAYFER